MTTLSECVDKYADIVIEKFQEETLSDFIKCFEVYGLNLLISKITPEHDLYDSFLRFISRYKHKEGILEEVQKTIWDFLIAQTKSAKASNRLIAIESLAESGYDFGSYFEEMLKTETNKMIRGLLTAHLNVLFLLLKQI